MIFTSVGKSATFHHDASAEIWRRLFHKEVVMPASSVAAIPAAASAVAQAHFAARLSLETDCADVHEALLNGSCRLRAPRCARAQSLCPQPRAGRAQSSASGDHGGAHGRLARGHAVRGLLRRPALQRRRQGGVAAGAARTSGEADARRHDGLGRRGVCLRAKAPNPDRCNVIVRRLNSCDPSSGKGGGSLRPLCGRSRADPTYPQSYQQL